MTLLPPASSSTFDMIKAVITKEITPPGGAVPGKADLHRNGGGP